VLGALVRKKWAVDKFNGSLEEVVVGEVAGGVAVDKGFAAKDGFWSRSFLMRCRES
jgi:hypothetical protein